MRTLTTVFAAAAGLLLAACATAPTTPEKRQELVREADSTLQMMQRRDPALQSMLQRSAGYAVFPSIGKGGAIVGGAYGRGIVYQGGQPVGYVDLTQGSLGAQLGGETFSELIVFERPQDLAKLKDGRFDLGAGISATALTAGAAAETSFAQGVAVFVVPRGGLMIDVSVSGQQLNFTPAG